jgi:CHAT domain-containing protein
MRQFTLNSFLLILGLLISSQSLIAQYAFESKKSEKQYYKFDDAYMDYNYNKILNMEGEMLAMFESKQDTVTANVYSFLAEAYLYGLEDMQKGIEYYEKEYELRSQIQPDESKADLAYNLAYAYDLAGQYGKSEKLYLDLIEEDKATSGRKSTDYIMSVQGLADHYTLTGEAEKGLKLIKQNKRGIERKSYDEAMMLRYEGDFLEMKGQYSKSEDALLKSLETMEEAGYYPSLEYAYTLNSLGTVYTNSGQLPAAEKTYETAMSILQRLSSEDEEGLIGTQYNMSLVYQDLGNYEESIKLLEGILEVDESYYGRESVSYVQDLNELGYTYYLKEDFFTSEEKLLEGLGILEDLGETESLLYSIVSGTLARTYSAIEDFDQAESYAKQAMKGMEAAGLTEGQNYARAIGNLAEIYMKAGKTAEANEYTKLALDTYEKLLGNKHPLYATAARRVAIVKWQQEELDEALNYYQKTFDNYFAQINAYFPILSEEEKSKFYYNRLRPTFEQFNSFVIENRSEDPVLLSKMYDYQLATKGLIFYATNKVRESILNSGDSSLIEQYETWIGQKESLAQLFSASDLAPDVRDFKIDSLSKAANDLEKQLGEASAVFASNFASQDLTWQDVRDKLKPGEAAVEIVRFRDFDPENGGMYSGEVYYTALIVKHDTEESPEIVIMRNGSQMETKYLSNYRNAIKYQMNEVYSYRLFWRPLSNKLEGINKIYFSPDGVYNQISIYTLQNPATKKFTIDEFEFQLITNTKDLVISKAGTGQNSGQSYLFGYPNYNMGGNQTNEPDNAEGEQRSLGRGVSRGVRGSEPSEDIKNLTRGGLPRGIRGNLLRYMGSGSGMPLLPGTQKEVNLIDSLYVSASAKPVKYMENIALEDNIKSIKNPKTLHIATHGFFLEEPEEGDGNKDHHVSNPLLRSGLIMAGANSYIREGAIEAEQEVNDDGILTAYEAMNLNLDQTDLVVLSACETGLGEVKNGEGVYGLQRAFKVAGADAIIMSMWTVDDDATQELMTIFYEEWLSGKSKRDAFNMAQKRLKDKWKKPYYWGAFVMVGE